jgi:hypothetical protein
MADSTRLERLFDEACRAVNDGDISFFEQHLHEAVLAVGSAPGEMYRGRRELLDGLRRYGAIPVEVHTKAAGLLGATPDGASETSTSQALQHGCPSSQRAAGTAGGLRTGTFHSRYRTRRAARLVPGLKRTRWAMVGRCSEHTPALGPGPRGRSAR